MARRAAPPARLSVRGGDDVAAPGSSEARAARSHPGDRSADGAFPHQGRVAHGGHVRGDTTPPWRARAVDGAGGLRDRARGPRGRRCGRRRVGSARSGRSHGRRPRRIRISLLRGARSPGETRRRALAGGNAIGNGLHAAARAGKVARSAPGRLGQPGEHGRETGLCRGSPGTRAGAGRAFDLSRYAGAPAIRMGTTPDAPHPLFQESDRVTARRSASIVATPYP